MVLLLFCVPDFPCLSILVISQLIINELGFGSGAVAGVAAGSFFSPSFSLKNLRQNRISGDTLHLHSALTLLSFQLGLL